MEPAKLQLFDLPFSTVLHACSFLAPAETATLRVAATTSIEIGPYAIDVLQSNELWFLYCRARWNLSHFKFRPDKAKYWLNHYRQNHEQRTAPKGRFSVTTGVWSQQPEQHEQEARLGSVDGWVASINTDDNRVPRADLVPIPMPAAWAAVVKGSAGLQDGDDCSSGAAAGGGGSATGGSARHHAHATAAVHACDSCALAATMQASMGHYLGKFTGTSSGAAGTSSSARHPPLPSPLLQPAISTVFQPSRARRMSVGALTSRLAAREKKDGMSRGGSRAASRRGSVGGAAVLGHGHGHGQPQQLAGAGILHGADHGLGVGMGQGQGLGMGGMGLGMYPALPLVGGGGGIGFGLAGQDHGHAYAHALPPGEPYRPVLTTPVDVNVPGTHLDDCPGAFSAVDGVVQVPVAAGGAAAAGHNHYLHQQNQLQGMAMAGGGLAAQAPSPTLLLPSHPHLYLKLVLSNVHSPCPVGIAAAGVRLVTREGAAVTAMTPAGKRPVVAVDGDALEHGGADAVVLPVLGSAVLRLAFPLPLPLPDHPPASTGAGGHRGGLQPSTGAKSGVSALIRSHVPLPQVAGRLGLVAAAEGGRAEGSAEEAVGREASGGAGLAALEAGVPGAGQAAILQAVAGEHGRTLTLTLTLPIPEFHHESLEQCAGGRLEVDMYHVRPSVTVTAGGGSGSDDPASGAGGAAGSVVGAGATIGTAVSAAGTLCLPFRWDLEDALGRTYRHVAGGVVVRAERDAM